jgi:DNA-binding MarR family transcriptional regulator
MKNDPRTLLPLVIADIFELAGHFRRHGEALTRTAGQTQARWQVLSAASAEAKTVPQIARRLGIARQSVQRIADLLVKEGAARYAPNPDHRTSPFLVPTTAGSATLARLTTDADAFHAEVIAATGGSDLPALHLALRRLLAGISRLDAEEADDRSASGPACPPEDAP